MTSTPEIQELAQREYKYGFVTEIESEAVPPGLNEEIIRTISRKKEEPDFLLEWRLKAYRHWLKMEEPRWWPKLTYPLVKFDDIIYYSAPKKKVTLESLDQVDPELLRTFDRLGISLDEQKRLTGVAVDAVFDSVSVATTFKETLAEKGILFCSFSEAVHQYPDLIRKYLGSVVPYTDNFYAALNSAVFSDGSFCYIPKGVRCPMELSTYFRINAAGTGQFERTLIIAEEGSYVSYLEGCLPEWEEVSCGDVIKPIPALTLDDHVLTSQGEETAIDKLMTRKYSGDLIEITPLSPGNRFHLTPEHPLLVVTNAQVRRALRKGGRDEDGTLRSLEAALPSFLPAGEVSCRDFLVYPISQISKDSQAVSDRFLEFLGFYMADGAPAVFEGHPALEFFLRSHEAYRLEKITALCEEITGKKPLHFLDQMTTTVRLVVPSKELADLCEEHGGKGEDTKRLSKLVMDLPPARQKLTLDGFYKNNPKAAKDRLFRRISVSTLSRIFAFQLQELLSRQGIFASIQIREAHAAPKSDGRPSLPKTKYMLAHSENTRSKKVKRLAKAFLIPIRQIKRQAYEGLVFNLETKKDHTYLVKGFATHNCTAPQRDENQLHAAVVELIALDRAQIKYSTVQNWYPGDKEGKGGIYNFVTKRGLCAGVESKISWTQVETGSAITWKYPSCILKGDGSIGEFYSVALTNNFQQADTGTKMIHLGKNTSSTIVSKGISAGRGQNSYRGLVRIAKNATHSRNYTQCDSMLIGETCGAHTFPYIEVQNSSSKVEHEASTSKIGEDQLFYCLQRGLSLEDAVSMIVNGFCKEVFRELPMEFAVEAQKLLGISLEGSVG